MQGEDQPEDNAAGTDHHRAKEQHHGDERILDGWGVVLGHPTMVGRARRRAPRARASCGAPPRTRIAAAGRVARDVLPALVLVVADGAAGTLRRPSRSLPESWANLLIKLLVTATK